MPKRLLLVDPIPTHRIRLKAVLRAAQYDIVSVDRIACAAGAIEAGPADLILLNTSGSDPAEMMTRLRRAIGQSDIPVLCRDDEAGPMRRMQALSTGARDMVATRVPDRLLLARLRGMLRDAEAAAELERRRIAAASFGFREAGTPFEAAGEVICIGLGSEMLKETPPELRGSRRIRVLGREELLRDDTRFPTPDVIILNTAASEMDQLDDLLPEIRMRSHLRQSSVIVLYPQGAYQLAERALNLGASEIAEAGASETELALRIDAMLNRQRIRDALRQTEEESYRLATIDTLTGLYNRRYAEVYLADALLHAMETGSGLTVMMVDIDHFKAVNDSFGHAAGDAVLRDVAARIRDNLRAMDLVSRHGGEEFLVILPDIDGAEAELAAERLRGCVGGSPISLPNGTRIEVTVSIGVAVTQIDRAGRLAGRSRSANGSPLPLIEDLLSRSDRALYSAKDAGRNCVSVSRTAASAA